MAMPVRVQDAVPGAQPSEKSLVLISFPAGQTVAEALRALANEARGQPGAFARVKRRAAGVFQTDPTGTKNLARRRPHVWPLALHQQPLAIIVRTKLFFEPMKISPGVAAFTLGRIADEVFSRLHFI